MIPIIINNRNRLTFLKDLLAFLSKLDCRIIILDNESTYEPLLEFYNSISKDVEIVCLNENLGHQAIYKWKKHLDFKEKFFIYTDSDIVPTEYCPSDLLEYLQDNKQKYYSYQKIGLSLKTDDIPEFYLHKNQVIEWEKNLIRKNIDDCFTESPVDTTFAIYEKDSLSAHVHLLTPCLRTKFPYQARHMPWYSDTNKLSYEESFYIAKANAKFININNKESSVGMWTQLDKKKFIKL